MTASRAAELLRSSIFVNRWHEENAIKIIAAELARVERETVERCAAYVSEAAAAASSTDDILLAGVARGIRALAAPEGE